MTLQIAAALMVCAALAQPAFSAEPAVKLPPFPTKAELEAYQDSEEMFAALLLDYFQAATTLEAQLNYWGVKPAAAVPSPTLEELSGQDSKTLRKFYAAGSKLQRQIEALPEEQMHAHLFDVQKRLKQEREKSMELLIKNFELELKAQQADAYTGRMMQFVRTADSLKRELDSVTYLYYALKMSGNSAMARALDDTFIPSLMLSNAVHALSIGEDNVRQDISYGAKAEVNLNALSGFGKYLDLWFAYLMPQIKSNAFPESPGSQWREWNSNIYSFGANLNLPDVLEIHPAKAGIKIGAGHYWGSASSPNIAAAEVDYKGQTLNLEVYFSKFTTISPASVYINFGVLFPTREMIFSDVARPVNIGKSTITTFGLGLRFTVL